MSNPSGDRTMWQPTIPVDQSIYEASATQKAPLGTRLEVGERVFYYGQAGEALVAGNVVSTPTLVASDVGANCTAVLNTAPSAKYVTITCASVVASGLYNEGFAVFQTGGSMAGAVYKIRSHGAAASAGTAQFNLYDALYATASVIDEIALIKNPYKGVIKGSQAINMPVGVAPCPISASYYAWLQTYGVASITGTVAAGAVVAMDTLGKCATILTGTTAPIGTEKIIGCNLGVAGTAAEPSPVFVKIRP